jgi:hypothetical protein
MHGHEKSDPVIVAMKPANKAKELTAEASAGANAAESVEARMFLLPRNGMPMRVTMR